MFFTLWKPYVMFLLNSLALLLYLSVLWRCHLLYLLPMFLQLSLMWRCHLWYCLTTYTIVGIADGSTLPLIIFYALKYVLSCSLFTPKPKTPPFSTLFFLLKALLGESIVAFFLFSNVFCISSLVLLTLANVFYGLSF